MCVFLILLEDCTEENLFNFNEQLYLQKDSAPMGGCAYPTPENLFQCYHEIILLNNCPADFKPSFYARYMDHTYTFFSKF